MVLPSVLFEQTLADDRDVLEAVANHLSTCRYEPETKNHCGSSNKNSQVTATNALRTLEAIWCPCLSLHHEHVGGGGGGETDQGALSQSQQAEHPRTRSSAEKHATALLARPLCLRVHGNATSGDDKEQHQPEELLNNIYKSFALLVESRIRAYAILIARHTQRKLQQVDSSLSKREVIHNCLNRLLLISSAIYAERRETCFELVHDQDVVMLDLEDGDDDADEAKHSSSSNHPCQPLTLRVAFDLVMPRSAEEKQVVSIAVEALGHIHVVECADSKSQRVHVELGVHDLLHGLMEQAAEVVTVVAEIASSPTVKPSSTPMARSASFLAMPPPKKRSRQQQDDDHHHPLGLELLCQAAAELPIVSPEMWAHRAAAAADEDQATIPALQLGTPALACSEDDDEDFSPDQCAEMVDNILGPVDDSIFGQPCCKKSRVSAEIV